MTVNEFQGRTDLQLNYPLAMGEMFGIRSWSIDHYGRLLPVSVTAGGAWRPGVNTAGCHKSHSMFGGMLSSFVLSYEAPPSIYYDSTMGMTTYKIDAPKVTKPKVNLTKKPPHVAPVEGCTCGFYAYATPNHESLTGRIVGVIRGSGRTLIGTRGFRCEKAEIVGFLDPSRGGKKPRRVNDAELLGRVYPDVPQYPSRRDLLEAWPLSDVTPDPSAPDFWSLP